MKKSVYARWAVQLILCCSILYQLQSHGMVKIDTPSIKKYILESTSNSDSGVSGLDNPRKLSISKDGKKVFVVSADDNALSIFARKKAGKLQFKQTFKNIDNPAFKLEGASGVITFNNDELLVTTSFYDGAVSLFKKTDSGAYQFVHALSDNLTPHRVFKDPRPLDKLDTLRILGAWGLIKLDKQRFAVASYQSDAVSFFHIKNGQLLLDKTVNDALKAHRFSRPIAIQPLGDKTEPDGLLVLGNEAALLTVLQRGSNNIFHITQVMNLKDHGCLSPQDLYRVKTTNLIYVACTGSEHILVLSDLGTEAGQNRFQVLQAFKAPSLKAISSLVFTPDGKTGFGAAENGKGIIVLNTKELGHVEVKETILEMDLFSISSLTLWNNDTLLVTLAKQDSIVALDVSTLN
jgi:WD40 repeat protein